MCNVSDDQLINYPIDRIFEVLLSPLDAADEEAQYHSSYSDLELRRAQSRLSAQESIADGVFQRESYQRQAAQESGKTKAGYGASNLALDSGSVLQVMTDKDVQTQAESANITRKIGSEVERQRMNEEYYSRKQKMLYDSFSREQRRKTLLGAYGAVNDGISFLTS